MKPSEKRQGLLNKPATKKAEIQEIVDSDTVTLDEVSKLARDNSRKLDIIIELLTKHADFDDVQDDTFGCPCAMVRGSVMGNAYVSCSSSYRTASTCTFDGEDYKMCEIYRKTML